MQHPSQGTFSRRQFGSFDGVGSTYSTSGTPYSPNSSSGSPMMQAYHADGLTMAMGHVGMASMNALMDQQSHTSSNLSTQNTVPPPSQQQQHQQPQQQQGQQQAMPVHMNGYLHQQQQQQHSNQNNTNQHVSLGSNSSYAHSPIEINHSPTHMHPPPTPTGSNRASIVSNGHEEAVAAAAVASVAHNHPTGQNLHRSATHPGVGSWSVPPPAQMRMSQQGHPMSIHQHHQAQMAQMQMRHPQGMPHPSYPGHYPGQQQHHPQLQPGPPPPYTRGIPPLRALDAYLLARAIQSSVPHNEVAQIVLYAQANNKPSNLLLQAYEQQKREIDELVNQLRQEDAQLSVMGHAMSMSPTQMGMNMSSITGMNGNAQNSYASSHIPPSIVSLQPHNTMSMSMHSHPHPHAQGSHPNSAPSSSHPPSFQRNPSTGASELDVPSSEASSPMLETPTSASLPSAMKSGSGINMSTMSNSGMNSGMPPPPSGPAPLSIPEPPFVHTPSKPSSRDGEPYNASEIALIEWVIREAIQAQPDIKLAQLGVLIHAKDPGRPATAWARQLSKRKLAIERARDIVKRGGSIAEWPIEVNGRGGGSGPALPGALDAMGMPIKEEDESDGDEIARRTRAKREEDDDAEYGERPSKRRRGS